MKVAVLTSSRADFGIYTPLLELLRKDKFFDFNIVAFGTHLSKKHGATIKEIVAAGYNVKHQLKTTPQSDDPASISKAVGKTVADFSTFWEKNKFDLVIALGDRYEMFAAALATVPFNTRIAHIGGGETTAGAIDNFFRHSISLMSSIHFTSHDDYKKRVKEITGSSIGIYNVGSLSTDNLKKMKFYSLKEIKTLFNVDLSVPTILITFHPETVNPENNNLYIKELVRTLEQCTGYQLLITMPNADTYGKMVRDKLNAFIKNNSNAIGVESLGSRGYLSCMKHCKFMLGNTSSGFVEAAFFQKPVVNLGDRQKGRIITPNIINSEITYKAMLGAIKKASTLKLPKSAGIYGNGDAAQKIIQVLKKS